MSKRAEEAAWKIYPVIKDEHSERDINNATRRACMRGYEQAEKDLALTAKDVERIYKLVREHEMMYNATLACYQEVADIFNAERK